MRHARPLACVQAKSNCVPCPVTRHRGCSQSHPSHRKWLLGHASQPRKSVHPHQPSETGPRPEPFPIAHTPVLHGVYVGCRTRDMGTQRRRCGHDPGLYPSGSFSSRWVSMEQRRLREELSESVWGLLLQSRGRVGSLDPDPPHSRLSHPS